MNPASRKIRWIVFSAWAASLIALPFCAPAALFASQVVGGDQKSTASCPCGEHCYCLVCFCRDNASESKPTPSLAKTDSRELGIFETVAAFVNPFRADKGYEPGSPSMLVPINHAPQTLVAQCTCRQV